MKTFTQSVLILIAVLISAAGAEDVEYVQVGGTVTLTCPVSNPQYKYLYWKFNKMEPEIAWSNHLGGKNFATEEKWKDKLSMSGNSLIIRNVQQENFGTFSCETASNGPSQVIHVTQLLKLNVHANPSSPLLPGDNLSLTCNADTPQGGSKPVIYWLNPQGKRTNQGTIRKITTIRDHGYWTCVVGKKPEKQTKISITVVDFSPGPSHVYTSISMPLIIPCSIPPYITWTQLKDKGIKKVYWQFTPETSPGPRISRMLYVLSLDPLSWKAGENTDLKPKSDNQNKDLTLTRKQGREDDRGDYVCTMKFENGQILNRTVRVEVLQIISSPGTDIISGQPLNLTCSLGHPLPSGLQVQWSPPQRLPLPSLNSDHHPARLTFPEVGSAHGGNWGCMLRQNKTQLTSTKITLKIEPRLSVWMLVIICSAAVIVILLLVLIFILCRRRQRKTKHPRHRLCHCKNPKPKGFYRT